MELDTEVKQALKELPPAQRVVAIALKKIYEDIRRLYDQEKKEIDDNRIKYFERYRDLQEKTASIVQGKKLTEEDLAKTNEYFVEEQKADIKTALELAAPIKDYWLVAMKNSQLGDTIEPHDEKILSHLTNLTSKVSANTVQITFVFQAGKEVQEGSYTRIIELDNGIPIRFKGDKIKLKQSLSQGLINLIFTDTDSEETIYPKFQVVTFLVNNIIPYSLRYFLGEAEIEGEEDDQEQGEDQDEEEEQQKGEKGRKQKN